MSAAYEDVHLNDVGTAFRVTLQDGKGVVDVSSPILLTMKFYKPESGLVSKTATLVTDGKDGLIEYVAEEGFLNEVGTWKIQGYVELSTGKWHSSRGRFKIVEP